jgi:NAD(P)-dependent dehydrogenase (short-subunit alcohol dehydrogenase family)
MENTTQHTNLNLSGKKVVILGGSAGIGLATAKAAANDGAEIIIVSSNQQRLDAALQQLPAGSKAIAADLANEQQVKALFNTIGNFDHLVYTAGETLKLANIADVVLADAQRFFNLRYWGAFTAVKYAAPFISAGGSITLTGGIASSRPAAGWSLGTSICAAMEGFTRAMAIELAPVRVNLVAPGVVKTDLWSNMPEADRENFYTSVGNSLPVKRVGEADDIALSYLYFMRQQYGTGQSLIVDGGSVLV